MTRIALGLFLSLLASSTFAHPGGLDANGCHNNRTAGVYECHSGESAGTTWENRDAYEATLVAPDVPDNVDSGAIVFVGTPDWSTLKKYPVLFRQETVWMVSDGQYMYQVEPDPNGEYPLRPVSRAKLTTLGENEFAQLIQAIQDAQQ